MQPLIQFKRTTSLLLIPLLLACFGLSPRAQAVVPAPDGGYPGGNTAEGAQALFSLTTGGANTAIGFQALFRNTTGVDNAATGWRALFHNTIGDANTANGFEALFYNTTGGDNIAVGFLAGTNLTTGSNNIDIGNFGVDAESNAIRIGRPLVQTALTYIAGISGTTVPNGVAVVVGTDGHLGTISSSCRFKDEIKPMDNASEAILALKPVTFRYKQEFDPKRIPQFGLVAEEVEKVNPDLVKRDRDGNLQTVRYEAVNAMLLNEFLKEHQKFEEQLCKAQEQEAAIVQLK